MKFNMECTCGHKESVEARSRAEAAVKFRSAMTQEALEEHFSQYHGPNDPKPTLEEARAAIAQSVAVTV